MIWIRLNRVCGISALSAPVSVHPGVSSAHTTIVRWSRNAKGAAKSGFKCTASLLRFHTPGRREVIEQLKYMAVRCTRCTRHSDFASPVARGMSSRVQLRNLRSLSCGCRSSQFWVEHATITRKSTTAPIGWYLYLLSHSSSDNGKIGIETHSRG